MSTMSGNQSMLSSFIAMMALSAVVLLVALMLLGGGLGEVSQAQVQAVRQSVSSTVWAIEGQVTIEAGLRIREHAVKHQGQALDAWKIYAQLLAGKCVASTMLCGGSEIEKLYLCVDPASGLVGGLLVLGDEILTGYGSRAGYWESVVERDKWEACDD